MLFRDGFAGRRPVAKRRMGVVAGAGKVLGTPVPSAVPLQRHHPGLVMAACVGEIVATAGLVATGSLVAMVVLLGTSAALIGLIATNRRRILAITGKGNVVLAASVGGWPTGVIGPADRDLVLPEPAGLGVAIDLGSQRWWIDRSSFRLLRRARLVQTSRDGDR